MYNNIIDSLNKHIIYFKSRNIEDYSLLIFGRSEGTVPVKKYTRFSWVDKQVKRRMDESPVQYSAEIEINDLTYKVIESCLMNNYNITKTMNIVFSFLHKQKNKQSLFNKI